VVLARKKAGCGKINHRFRVPVWLRPQVSSTSVSSQACEDKDQMSSVKKESKLEERQPKDISAHSHDTGTSFRHPITQRLFGEWTLFPDLHFLLWISMFNHSSALEQAHQVRVIIDTADVISKDPSQFMKLSCHVIVNPLSCGKPSEVE
jgi:hypothetical protein